MQASKFLSAMRRFLRVQPDLFGQSRFVMPRKFCHARKRRAKRFRLHPDPLGIGSDERRFAWIRLVYSIYTTGTPSAELSIRSTYIIGSYERNSAFHSNRLADCIQATIPSLKNFQSGESY